MQRDRKPFCILQWLEGSDGRHGQSPSFNPAWLPRSGLVSPEHCYLLLEPPCGATGIPRLSFLTKLPSKGSELERLLTLCFPEEVKVPWAETRKEPEVSVYPLWQRFPQFGYPCYDSRNSVLTRAHSRETLIEALHILAEPNLETWGAQFPQALALSRQSHGN